MQTAAEWHRFLLGYFEKYGFGKPNRKNKLAIMQTAAEWHRFLFGSVKITGREGHRASCSSLK